jgi:hypothetical protein
MVCLPVRGNAAITQASPLEVGIVHQVELGELLLGVILDESGSLTLVRLARASEVDWERTFVPGELGEGVEAA